MVEQHGYLRHLTGEKMLELRQRGNVNALVQVFEYDEGMDCRTQLH